MSKPVLRTLIIEDSEDDAFLLVRFLQQTYELKHIRVDSADGLKKGPAR